MDHRVLALEKEISKKEEGKGREGRGVREVGVWGRK